MFFPRATVTSVALAASVLTVGLRARADEKLDITGEYQCEGTNARGAKYTAAVSISKQQATYVVKWDLPSQDQIGVGILEGDLLSVSWVSQGAAGIVVYKIRNHGDTLVGRWAQVGGDGQTFSEVLTRPPGQQKSPSMAGRNPATDVPMLVAVLATR